MKKQSGFGAIEIVLIAVLLVAIGGIVFYAVRPKPQSVTSNTKTSPAPAPNAELKSLDDIKSSASELEKDDTADITTELNALESDLKNL